MLWIQAVISRGLLWTEIHGGIWTASKIFMKTILLIIEFFLTNTSAIEEYWSSVQLVSLNLKLEMTFSVSKSEIS